MGFLSKFKKRGNEYQQHQEFMPPLAPPESNIELQTFLVTPDSQRKFRHIDRDMTLSNLNDFEVKTLISLNELVGIFKLSDLDTARQVFEHDGKVVLNVTRSRRGFERKMVSTTRAIVGKDEESKKRRKFDI